MENNIDKTEPSIANTENLAEKFNKSIVKKNVHAKLPLGTKINGTEISPFYTKGFFDHGPDKDLGSGFVGASLGEILLRQKYYLPELANSHFLSIKEETDRENKILAIVSLQDAKVETRGYTPACVVFEMPNKEADEFIEEVKKDPDLLEKLYQKAFEGLESKNENPGLRRVRANGFYLIPEGKRRELALICENQYKISHPIEKFKEFFNNLDKCLYKNGPYGSGKPFTP